MLQITNYCITREDKYYVFFNVPKI